MADGMSVDRSELDGLARGLLSTSKHIVKFARKATEVSSRNIKDGWADKLRGSEALPHAHRAINYDIVVENVAGGATIVGEIGADLSLRQGNLVHFAEYGSPTSSPRGYGHRSLQEEEEGFDLGLQKAAEDAEREAGL